jgi:pilus assembly protein CpaE
MSSLETKVLLLLEHGVESAAIEEALPSGTRVRRASLPEGPQEWSSLRDAASDAELLIFGVQQGSARILDLVEAAARELPKRPPIVLIHSGSPNGFMQRAFEAGADDLITLPQSPAQLTFALEKAIARRRSAEAAATQTGELITILGPKGGTGKTLTSCNLAVALARAGRSPVVVDIDLQFGDVGLALGLRPHRTIYDLAVAGGTIDAGKVDDFLVRHESGTRALLAPVRPDQAAAVSVSVLKTVFEVLRSRHDFVIVDTPPAFSPEVITAIDVSSQLCMVGMLDVLSLKDTKIGLQTLAQIGHDPERVTLVLNRADTNVGIAGGDVEQLLGRKPDVLVPSDRAIPRAVTEGKTIVEAEPSSEAARAFQELALIASRDRVTTATPAAPVEANVKNRRRLSLLRKEMA